MRELKYMMRFITIKTFILSLAMLGIEIIPEWFDFTGGISQKILLLLGAFHIVSILKTRELIYSFFRGYNDFCDVKEMYKVERVAILNIRYMIIFLFVVWVSTHYILGALLYVLIGAFIRYINMPFIGSNIIKFLLRYLLLFSVTAWIVFVNNP